MRHPILRVRPARSAARPRGAPSVLHAVAEDAVGRQLEPAAAAVGAGVRTGRDADRLAAASDPAQALQGRGGHARRTGRRRTDKSVLRAAGLGGGGCTRVRTNPQRGGELASGEGRSATLRQAAVGHLPQAGCHKQEGRRPRGRRPSCCYGADLGDQSSLLFFRPRRYSRFSASGCLPRHFTYISIGSSVPPRDRMPCR